MARQSAVPALVVALALFGIGMGLALARTGVGPIMLELHRWGLVPEAQVAKAVDVDASVKERVGGHRVTKLGERKGGC